MKCEFEDHEAEELRELPMRANITMWVCKTHYDQERRRRAARGQRGQSGVARRLPGERPQIPRSIVLIRIARASITRPIHGQTACKAASYCARTQPSTMRRGGGAWSTAYSAMPPHR